MATILIETDLDVVSKLKQRKVNGKYSNKY